MRPRTPGVRSLRVLEAAGRHLNFTRASVELNLTPAAVSHQIKEWEAQLGFALFIRANRSLRFTTAGEVLHRSTQEALANLDNAVAQARRLSGQERTRLNVSVSTSIAAKWLVPRLDRFQQIEPNVEVRLNVTCQIQDFRQNDIDLAIRFGPQDVGLHTDRLFDHVIFPVCSPRLLKGERSMVDPRDLRGRKLIHQSWSGRGVVWPDWRQWLQAAGIFDFDFEPGLHYTDTHLAVQAAIEGEGIALGDEALVADDLAAGRLVRPFDLSIGGPPSFAYFVVSPLETMADPLIRGFRAWLLSEAATMRLP
ncbi:transcriptional regulator GcvA [Sinorhizobium sp. RAC02]|uniref:transcriptional regulator GcvA n=1 Tax=Sinorhizobium sp. RAC02 TaxID=1842534 RepID=UPI00083DF6F3|nr:transcriptional regulator GcvA [Sinorhizobium sp. RAC02]AOF90488.1 bacterial regulatory helix-turn-helix, lysR family protein [Sinorhizobium sp. RAC02]